LKVQLFRFVDALPSLPSSGEIARHIREYLGSDLPGWPVWARYGAKLAPEFPRLTAALARRGVTEMAEAFILAPNAAAAVPEVIKMRDERLAFTLTSLGRRQCRNLKPSFMRRDTWS